MTALNLPMPLDVVDRALEFPCEVLCLMTNRPAHSRLQSIKGWIVSDLFEQVFGVLQVPFNVSEAHGARAYLKPMPMMPARRCQGCHQLVTERQRIRASPTHSADSKQKWTLQMLLGLRTL